MKEVLLAFQGLRLDGMYYLNAQLFMPIDAVLNAIRDTDLPGSALAAVTVPSIWHQHAFLQLQKSILGQKRSCKLKSNSGFVSHCGWHFLRILIQFSTGFAAFVRKGA